MQTPPCTPTSILRRIPDVPAMHVSFAPQSLTEALDPIWRERLLGFVPSRRDSSGSYSSSITCKSFDANDFPHRTSLHSDDGSRAAEDVDFVGLSDYETEKDADFGSEHAVDVLFYPPRDSIEISIGRSRAAAMQRLAGVAEPVFLRTTDAVPAFPALSPLHIDHSQSVIAQKRVKKKPSTLNLLAEKLVTRVKQVAQKSPRQPPSRANTPAADGSTHLYAYDVDDMADPFAASH